MTKHTRLALITSVWLLLAGAAETQAQHFLLESADRLKLHNVTAEPSTLQGKKGLQLTLPEEVRRRVNKLQSMTPEKRERSMTSEERARARHRLPFLVGQLALVQEVEPTARSRWSSPVHQKHCGLNQEPWLTSGI